MKKTDELTDKPATAYKKSKRTRRTKAVIIADKLKKFYGDIDAVDVQEALSKAIKAVNDLDALAKEKDKRVSVSRLVKGKSKEELQLIIQKLQEEVSKK